MDSEIHVRVPIGIIVRHNKKCELRFVGHVSGGLASFDETFFRCAFPQYRSFEWIFELWMDWFVCIASDFRHNPSGALAKISRLELENETITASIHGEIELYDDDLPKLADQLFDSLVMNNSMMRQATFEAGIKRVFNGSEIPYFDECTMDAELELLDADGDIDRMLYFEAFCHPEDGQPCALRTLNFEQSRQAVGATVCDILNVFEVVQGSGLVSPSYSVVLHNMPELEQQNYLEMLSKKVTLVEMSDPDAPNILRRIFLQNSEF